MNQKIPSVIIVGRPNVGKSTLFNALVREKKAIVSQQAGTTRDQVDSILSEPWGSYELIDLAGIDVIYRSLASGGDKKKVKKGELPGMSIHEEFSDKHWEAEKKMLEKEIQTGILEAIKEASLILFMVDASEGVTELDRDVARILRKSQKKVVLVANKAEKGSAQDSLHDFYSLGMGEVLPTSTLGRIGLTEVRDVIRVTLAPLIKDADPEASEEVDETEKKKEIKVSIIGTPNVGKSSLFNAIIQKKKALVSDIPGTTRDTIDSLIMYEGTPIRFLDTAGLRRRGKIVPGIESFSVIRTKAAVEKSDVALLVMDAKRGVRKQDQHVAELLLDSHTGVVLVVNKWDLTENVMMDRYVIYLQKKFPFLSYAPVVFTSALTNRNIEKLPEMIVASWNERQKVVDEAQLTTYMKSVVLKKPIPKNTFISIMQTGTNPPAFRILLDKEYLHYSAKRYLERQIREKFGFEGTPIDMEFTTKPNKRNQKGGRKKK